MRFRRIAELSDITRMPRVGKIHLGVKKVSQKSGNEYPTEVDYFVFDPENSCTKKIIELYGSKPKEIPIAFPTDDDEVLFPQALKYYGSGKGLVCTGDGREAKRIEGLPFGASSKDLKIEGQPDMVEIECGYKECPDYVRGACKQMGNLMVLLPEVTLAGVWQIDTSSYHSIVDLNSSLAYVRQIVGRVSMLFDRKTLRPFLTLRRVQKETHGSGRKEIHWPMIVALNVDVKTALEASSAMTAVKAILPEPSREDYLIPRDVRESLPPEPEAEPAKPNGQGNPPEPNSPPASAKGEEVVEPKQVKLVPPQAPAPKQAARKLSLF